MHHKILADECVDLRIVKRLRKKGFDVISVLKEYPSTSDRRVLELAKEHKAILLTEDSDFGNLFFPTRKETLGLSF